MLLDDIIKETDVFAGAVYLYIGDGLISLSLYTGNHRAKPWYVMVYSKELYLQAFILKGWLSLNRGFDVDMVRFEL